MSEDKLKKRVIHAIRKIDPVLVDNPRKPGTPDVNFIEGWVELKYKEDWPKRAGTLVKFPKFYPQQRVWLVKRSLAGGKCFVLLQVKFMYLLYEGGYAAQHFDKMTKDEMIKNAAKVWDYFPEMELTECLQ